MRGKKCDLSNLNDFSNLLLLVTDNNNNTALSISDLGFSHTIVFAQSLRKTKKPI